MAIPPVIFPGNPVQQGIIQKGQDVMAPRSKLDAPLAPLFVATPNPPDGVENTPYNYSLASDVNTTRGVTFTVINGSLPAGLAIVGLSLAGTPTTPGISSGLQLRVTNVSGTDDSAIFDIGIGTEDVERTVITGLNTEGEADGDIIFEYVAPPPPAPGGDLYVATDGNDSNPGTEAQPFRTVKKGLAELDGGDTLLIKDGAYSETNLFHNTIKSGTDGNPTIVRAETIGGVELQKSIRIFNNRAYISIIGIKFDGQLKSETGDGMKIEDTTNNIIVQDCEVTEFGKQGVLCNGSAHFLTFDRCELHNNGTRSEFDHGIYLKGDDCIIRDCDVHDNASFGIHCYNGSGSANRLLIERNRSHHNGANGILVDGNDGLIRNNLVYENLNRGLDNFAGNDNKWYHNTVWNNGGTKYRVRAGARTIFRNNIFFENVGVLDNGTGTIEENSFETDPDFVNSAIGDFHLQASSGARDFGQDLLADVPDDFDLVARDATPDVGGYEFV